MKFESSGSLQSNWISLAPLLFMAITITACNKGSESTSVTRESTISKIIEVAVEYPQEKTVIDTLVATGTIAAKQTSAIGPLVEGVVEKILVRVGDRVKKGQALFQTRNIDYVRRIDEVKAKIKVGQAEVDKAKRDVIRISELVARGLAATSTKEDAATILNIRLAKLTQVVTALSFAEQSYTDTIVRSPFDGAITARYVDEGTYMSNTFSGMGNSAVVQVQECEIAAAILLTPEANLSKLRLGYTGRLFVASISTPIDSKILIINDRVDPVSRMAEFRMAFRNPDCRVKAGQFVRGEIKLPARELVSLSRTSIRKSRDDHYVFVVIDGIVKRRSIEVIDLDAMDVEVLSGIKIGESVVANPKAEIRDGIQVEIRSS
ncbi:MAG: efflux RND transporter periplasmic adaptor subunit [Pseudomonadales bacterium]|nr:efflux RND transporter periplasmic adaptor subunit [Pseudomonadales bacterium]